MGFAHIHPSRLSSPRLFPYCQPTPLEEPITREAASCLLPLPLLLVEGGGVVMTTF